ncbi:MAG: sulfite exporter TauE/SafE family protein [Chloroflexi bacterium]|nr:sulfite exporter TauE/SafE family protein [Chloroflexota bacterium]
MPNWELGAWNADLVSLALVLLVIFGAAIVKGAIGFGFPLISVPLIAIILDARSAVIILSVASLVSSAGILFRGGGSRATLRRLAPTLAGLGVGTIGGALLVASIDASRLGLVVGASALIFVATSALKPDLAIPTRLERYLALPMGLLGGLLGGSTSIFSPVVVAYLHTLHLVRREFVFFLTVLFVVGGLVQVTSYARLGLYDARLLLIILLSCIPNLGGVQLGIRLQDRLDPVLFRRLVLAVITLSGLNLLGKGLWG